MTNSIETAAQAKTAIQSLCESLWLFSALNAILAAGAFKDVGAKHDMQALISITKIPATILEQTLGLLVHAGFVVKTDSVFQLAAGFQAHIKQIGIERFNASLCVTQGLSADYIHAARQQQLQSGWHYTDELILQSQGMYSQYIVTDCMQQDAALQKSLRQPDAVFLDVGAGVGQIAIRAGVEYPQLKIIALEPADVPFKLAQLNIKASSCAARIELRKCLLQEMTDTNAIDVAWFPHVFIDDTHLPACLMKLKQTLKPGGILMTTALTAINTNQTASVRQLINALYGGLRTADTVVTALKNAGFCHINLHPEIAGYQTITATMHT